MSNQYLCIARSATGECEPPSPAQMEAMYTKFNAWKAQFSENIVDMGGKLGAEGRVVSVDGVSDGPFMEVKEIVGGYMIITADSWEKAVEVIQEMPAGGEGTTFEIREISSP